jgi:guanosine-3',5'-bis(diphosphate) 3'-pyrophosphohydrolase
MRIETVLDSLPEIYTPIDREFILKAYQFAVEAHKGQKRVSGEPFITHCIAVANILAELAVPPAVIVAGLLHDTVEDTDVTLEDIRREFGDEVARLVDGVTKLSNLPRVSRSDSDFFENNEYYPGKDNGNEPAAEIVEADKRSRHKDMRNEILRKTFIAMGEDIRVVLIKLADRLHNLRTLSYLPEGKRQQIGQETLDIFAPLANRLGLWTIKWELEDLSFRYVDPEKYKEIADNLSERLSVREEEIHNIIINLTHMLKKAGVEAEISGRPKHIYSIYKKMQEKGEPFEMVRDLRGVRLIVADIPTCYAALGVIHTHWKPIPQEFDDYIAAPKENFYQSLHTTVIYDDGKPLEVQIRTLEMHRNAEYGIAAHWRYKEKGKRDDTYQQRINWLRRLMEWRQEVVDAQEFIDGMKTDVFGDRVYVFTPKGDIIDLPAGSTPIDFAYHVHTEIGHRCRGAKINGKLVTLDYILKTGDQVEILTSKQGGPSRDWLNKSLGLVNTQRARSKIRQWFKRQNYEQNVLQGKTMVERELQRLGLQEIDMEKIANSFDFRTPDDLYAALGTGDLNMGRIINRLSDLNKEKDPLLVLQPPAKVKDNINAVTVMGMRGMQTTISHCCNPAPGDEIIGYITRGRGVSIHRTDCPNILRTYEKERLIRVSWGEPRTTYPVSIEIKAYDRQGLMGDISNIINNENINVINMSLKINHNLATISLSIEVSDVEQLSRVLSRIENLPNVLEAHRLKPG